MALRHGVVFAVALVAAVMSGSAQTQTPAPTPPPNSGPVYVITFFETSAAAAPKAIA